MKNIGKLAVLGAVLAASASFAFADTIGSYATFNCPTTATCVTAAANPGDTNTALSFLGYVAQSFGNTPPFTTPGTTAPSAGTPAPTYTLLPGSTWTPTPQTLPNSTWVGNLPSSGPEPGTTFNPPQGFYTFSTTFTESQIESGLLDFYADDSTEVYLNGTLIAAFGTLGVDNHCADGTPNCSVEDQIGITSVAGLNTLTFVVVQAGNENANDPSGLDFSASLTPTSAPEPSSLMLLGTGLVGAAGMLFRRRLTA
jgi:hypothetical protein